MCGTWVNMPPEIIQKKGHDHTSDLWGIGIIMYKMLAGVSPFEGNNKSEIYE